jgi:hypothetical protein
VLDPSRAFRVDGVETVDVYPDLELSSRFYAVPTSPRVAARSDGGAAVEILVYRRRAPAGAAAPAAMGGMLSAGFDLSLTAAERAGLAAGLAELLAGVPGRREGEPPPEPVVRSPDWRRGSVELRTGAQTLATAQPSLGGTNACTLAGNLDGPAAETLMRAAREGGLDLHVAYRVVTVAGAREIATAATASEERHDDARASTRGHAATRATVAVTTAHELELAIEGSIHVSGDPLVRLIEL